MNEQWIEQMRQKMADYRRPAPEVSWDEIDRALTRRKPRLLWLRRVAAAAVVLLIAGVGCWWILNPPQTSLLEGRGVAVPEISTTLIEKEETTSTLQESEAAIPQTVVHSPKAVASLVEPAFTVSSENPDTASASPPTPLAGESGVDTLKAEKQQYPSREGLGPVDRTHRSVYPARLHQRRRLDNQLTAKVYLSNATNDSRQSTSFSQQWTETNVYRNKYESSNMDKTAGGTSYIYTYDTITTVHTSHIDQHVHHRQPVRFGLSLRYQLDDRWSVESGLTYTRLSSDITTTVDGTTTMTEQRLNYIGLPLNIGYDLWKNQHIGLYVKAGTTIEKRLDASPWQFSLNGAAGAEYKLTDVFSLYAEPGIGYYFSDGSTTLTIYQEHPLNFNLSFGLRFHVK